MLLRFSLPRPEKKDRKSLIGQEVTRSSPLSSLRLRLFSEPQSSRDCDWKEEEEGKVELTQISGNGNLLRRSAHVLHASDDKSPLGHRCPEEDGPSERSEREERGSVCVFEGRTEGADE